MNAIPTSDLPTSELSRVLTQLLKRDYPCSQLAYEMIEISRGPRSSRLKCEVDLICKLLLNPQSIHVMQHLDQVDPNLFLDSTLQRIWTVAQKTRAPGWMHILYYCHERAGCPISLDPVVETVYDLHLNSDASETHTFGETVALMREHQRNSALFAKIDDVYRALSRREISSRDALDQFALIRDQEVMYGR